MFVARAALRRSGALGRGAEVRPVFESDDPQLASPRIILHKGSHIGFGRAGAGAAGSVSPKKLPKPSRLSAVFQELTGIP